MASEPRHLFPQTEEPRLLSYSVTTPKYMLSLRSRGTISPLRRTALQSVQARQLVGVPQRQRTIDRHCVCHFMSCRLTHGNKRSDRVPVNSTRYVRHPMPELNSRRRSIRRVNSIEFPRIPYPNEIASDKTAAV